MAIMDQQMTERPSHSTALFYTPEEFAALVRVSERTVRRWIGEGKLKARRFGRQLRIPTEVLKEFGLATAPSQERDWAALASEAFAKDWENEKDAQYDHWEEHYGASKR